MKKREKVMLALFVIDLFLLLFYKQVREGVRTTFTYEKIVFWWFYFYPIAYFLGGYFLSYFILAKSKIVLDKKVQKMLLVLIAAVASSVCIWNGYDGHYINFCNAYHIRLPQQLCMSFLRYIPNMFIYFQSSVF